MKKLILFYFGVSLFSCNNHHKEFVINGLTTGFEDSTVVYLNDEEISKDVDSALIIGNSFVFKGHVTDSYKNYWIHTENYEQYKSIWVENKTMTFDARNSSFREAKVSGSSIQDQSNEWEKYTEIWDRKEDSLRRIAMQLSKTDTLKMKALKDEVKQIREKQKQAEIDFIKTHPDYELSSFFLTFLKNNITKEETQELFEGFDEKVKTNSWGKTIAFYIENSVDLKKGDKAVNFTLTDKSGYDITLSSFYGNYVLLEFWGSGCAPCRWENPNLLKAYRSYRNKGFEILGVCLDKSKEQWLSTIKQDSISWTTVSDLEGISGEVPVTYNVSYIPTNYLLDKEGVVIAKDLRGEQLQKKLKEIFEE